MAEIQRPPALPALSWGRNAAPARVTKSKPRAGGSGDEQAGVDRGARPPHIQGMTENQLLALVSSILVLIIVLRGRGRHVLRQGGLLPKIAIWLALFAAAGFIYHLFGPFGNF